MAIVNADSIFSKIKAYSETNSGKEKMKQAILDKKRSGNGITSLGYEILTSAKMKLLAEEFISYLKMTAASHDLPNTVMAHFDSLSYSVVESKDGSYDFYIYFTDDLSRESLDSGEYQGEGIRNIIALFNNGYVASNPAFGWWEGHTPTDSAIARSLPGDKYAFIKSKQGRPSLLFMQRATLDFTSKYAGKYNISLILDDIYEGDFITTI